MNPPGLMKNAFIYHEDFNKYDLGTDHPLIGDKPRNALEYLKKNNLLPQFDVLSPLPATYDDLLRAHTPEYLKHVQYLSENGGWLSPDTPAPKGIFEIASLATGGSILALDKLFNGYHLTINPLGGFHHACKASSSGFCFFNDIAVAIEHLRNTRGIQRFLIIDLDVHHGNGTQDIYYEDPSVLNISLHQDGRTLYPGTGDVDAIGRGPGEGFTVNLPLPPGAGSPSYLKAFREIVPPLVMQFSPQVIIYQSGVDTHHADPLDDLNLPLQIYHALATHVMKLSKDTCSRLAVLFGGGYNSESCIQAYGNIVSGLLGETTYQSELELPDADPNAVDTMLSDLRTRLADYWEL
jgi:acetoin utilization protein AcuC